MGAGSEDGVRKKLEGVAEALTGQRKNRKIDEEAWRALTPAERMKGQACETWKPLSVLPCNVWPVQVYLHCQSSALAGMSGAVLMGVSAQEVLAATRLLRAPAREWPNIVSGVQILGAKVAKIENDKAAARAKAK